MSGLPESSRQKLIAKLWTEIERTVSKAIEEKEKDTKLTNYVPVLTEVAEDLHVTITPRSHGATTLRGTRVVRTFEAEIETFDIEHRLKLPDKTLASGEPPLTEIEAWASEARQYERDKILWRLDSKATDGGDFTYTNIDKAKPDGFGERRLLVLVTDADVVKTLKDTHWSGEIVEVPAAPMELAGVAALLFRTGGGPVVHRYSDLTLGWDNAGDGVELVLAERLHVDRAGKAQRFMIPPKRGLAVTPPASPPRAHAAQGPAGGLIAMIKASARRWARMFAHNRQEASRSAARSGIRVFATRRRRCLTAPGSLSRGSAGSYQPIWSFLPPAQLRQGIRGNRCTRRRGALASVVAGGSYGGLVVRSRGFAGSRSFGRFSATTGDPIPTPVTTQSPALMVTNRRHRRPRPVDEPLTTTGAGAHRCLLMRNNGGGAKMVAPPEEPVRTVTTRGHQSRFAAPIRRARRRVGLAVSPASALDRQRRVQLPLRGRLDAWSAWSRWWRSRHSRSPNRPCNRDHGCLPSP